MKHLLIAAALGLSLVASAAPATPATPAKPAAKAATAAAPAAQLPPECVERIRKKAEKMKKELGLTEEQAAAVRNENQRFRGVMLTAAADHRAALAKILTPEQMSKLEGKRGELRQKRMDGCKVDDEDDDHDEDDDDKPKSKDKTKK
jgi:predicted lipid-binding transport protein (Tim44 family)